jgi:hypothetical protein
MWWVLDWYRASGASVSLHGRDITLRGRLMIRAMPKMGRK